MEETEVFAQEAADVAEQAVQEGVARIALTRAEVYQKAAADIGAARALVEDMERLGYLLGVPPELMEGALTKAIEGAKKTL
jgi:malate dehydrogenase (oxaloacetate-decarboxylating)